MILRIFKVLFAAAVGLNLLLTALDNAVFDYGANYGFMQHVLSMDSLFTGEQNTWRALRDATPSDGSYWVYHVFYGTIIAWEASAAVLCLVGAARLWQRRRADSRSFHKAKTVALAGLALSMLQWFLAFETVGGVWFQMWQSSTWNGLGAASRMFIYVAIILLFIRSPDDELENI